MIKLRLNNLLFSDVAMMATVGLMLPILPIYLIEKIPDANIQNITFAYSLYFISAVIFYWIYSAFLQHKKPWLRKQLGLIAGSLIIAAAPLGYITSQSMESIFLVQLIFGMGMGFFKASWRVVIKDIIKPDNKTFQKIHQLVVVLALAIAATIGGYIAYIFGYTILIQTMIYIALIGTILNLLSFHINPKK
ncbi:hypothetical protein KKG46_02485 [Patescibacteria group bacterium]|nr:hypothetical protein [Patescibacteria group bacterium]